MNLPLENTFSHSLTLKRERRTFYAHLCIAPLALSYLKTMRARFLHYEEESYFNKLDFERRQHSYLLGRYCAKHALSYYLNENDYTSIFIRRGVFEHPVVGYSRAHDAQVSIAHSSFWGAAIAFSQEHPMAIDIEMVDAKNNDVVKSQLTQREKRLVESANMCEKKLCAFLWSLKEAISKAIRCGMTTPFEVYEVESITFEEKSVVATFKNFGQYKGIVFELRDIACAIVLPKKTRMEICFNSLKAFAEGCHARSQFCEVT